MTLRRGYRRVGRSVVDANRSDRDVPVSWTDLGSVRNRLVRGHCASFQGAHVLSL